MLKLNRKQDYAILAVTHLSHPELQGPVSARCLAESTRIPPSILANILKDLSRAGLVNSLRGVHGGYELAAAPRDLSVGRLLRVLEGPTRLVECVVLPGEAESTCGCDLKDECQTRQPLQRIHDRIQQVLDDVTFDQLAARVDASVQGPFPLGLPTESADVR